MIEDLEKYKDFLIEGNYIDSLDFIESVFGFFPKQRYFTFKTAFEKFVENDGKVIVELGTSRSFVDGKYEGCLKDDPKYWEPDSPEKWDWGAGGFSRVAIECLREQNPEFYTIDIVSAHIERCKVMTEEFKKYFTYIVDSSLNFLSSFDKKIDLLYMDTGDVWPIESTANLHMSEAQIVVGRDLIADKGIILIDDVRNPTPFKNGDRSGLGKDKYSLPYLTRHGFKSIQDEYQIVLQKES